MNFVVEPGLSHTVKIVNGRLDLIRSMAVLLFGCIVRVGVRL
jgi:hypothetical protein